VGLSGRFDLSPLLRLTVGGSVGGMVDTQDFDPPYGLTWYWAVTAGIGLKVSDYTAFTLDARYAAYDGFAQALSASLGMEVTWPSSRGAGSASAARTHAVQPLKPGPRRGGTHSLPLSDRAPLALLSSGSIPALTAKVKTDPSRYLKQLSLELVKGAGDDFQKVRALHDWVATNIAYDADAFFGKSPMVTEPLEVIRHGASVCQGYAEVFQLMCGCAGFDCVVVSGYGRGLGFDPLREVSDSFADNHAWNAVRIGDLWYLVDCTWDSGSVSSSTQKYTPGYGTAYLFADPRGFLHTHYPGQAEWQLLEKPLTYGEFCALPFLTCHFFQAGFATGTGIERVTRTTDQYGFSLEAPETSEVIALLSGASKEAPQSVYVLRDGPHVRFQMAFPAPGTYTLSVCVGTGVSDSGTHSYEQVGQFCFVAAQGTPKVFPSTGFGPASSSVQFQGELPYDPRVQEEILLPFTVPQGTRIMATVLTVSGNVSTGIPQRAIIQDGEGGRQIVHATFPGPGEYAVSISLVTRQGETEHWDYIESFPVSVTKGTDRAFPILYSPYFDEGWSVITPLNNPLAKGSMVALEVVPPPNASLSDGEVQAVTGDKWFPLARGADGRFRATVKAGGADLMICVKRGKSYTGIMKYDVK
jgi:hypothetical protein